MQIIQLIKDYRERGFHVTAYDTGSGAADFVLALKIEEPIDLWYAYREGLIPKYDDKQSILYFPLLALDAASFKEIVRV